MLYRATSSIIIETCSNLGKLYINKEYIKNKLEIITFDIMLALNITSSSKLYQTIILL